MIIKECNMSMCAWMIQERKIGNDMILLWKLKVLGYSCMYDHSYPVSSTNALRFWECLVRQGGGFCLSLRLKTKCWKNSIIPQADLGYAMLKIKYVAIKSMKASRRLFDSNNIIACSHTMKNCAVHPRLPSCYNIGLWLFLLFNFSIDVDITSLL